LKLEKPEIREYLKLRNIKMSITLFSLFPSTRENIASLSLRRMWEVMNNCRLSDKFFGLTIDKKTLQQAL